MGEGTASLRGHGGRIDAAARLYPDAPRPWLDLSTGINPVPYPVPPLDPAVWHRLPLGAELDALSEAAARCYGRPRGTVLVPVPGSEIAIRLLPVLRPARRVAVLGPTYGSHAAAWRAAGAAVIEQRGEPLLPLSPCGRGWLREAQPGEGSAAPSALEPPSPASQPLAARHPLPQGEREEGGAWQGERSADALVVVNPNNPDGRRHAPDTLLAWAEQVGTLVVDEAFADVAPDLSLLAQPTLPDNVVVLRSLGKFFGLAGLRLGFVAIPERAAAAWRARLGDWPVSGPACAVGAAALADAAWQAATRARLAGDRARLDALLAGAGLEVLGGTDLYRYVAVAGGRDLAGDLARHGVLIRPFDHAPDRVRIGLPGAEADWRRLAAGLAQAGV